MNKEPVHGPFVVAFNGPPRAGKDTAANLLADMLDKSIWVNAPVVRLPLAQPMREAAMGLIGLPYNFAGYDITKDMPQDLLGGMTLRQLMIAFSEEFMKPRFGSDIWCEIWHNSIPTGFAGIVLIPDLGFQKEVDFLERRFGAERVVVVQVSREGRSYNGDSREPCLGTNNFLLENDGTLEDVATEVGRLIGRLTNKYRWQI